MSGFQGLLLANTQGGVTVTILPTSISDSAAAYNHTFAACTVTTTGGTPSSWLWTNEAPDIGVWSVNSGQGTASAAARVAGVSGTTEASCTFQCATTVNGVVYYNSTALTFFNSISA